jgi:Response regulators consisting of a CheY-like receiver domain and a winged-helix DNA-binding domain
VKLNLEATGRYQVRTEAHGSDGLSAVLVFKPDLIILDVVIGDKDGSEVAAEIKQNAGSKDIPIIYLTGIVKEYEEQSLRDFLGGYPFLAKPVSTEKLIACIEKNLKK